MAVRFLLVTAPSTRGRLTLWMATSLYANWIEGRPHPRREGIETWKVTVIDGAHATALLDVAGRLGATVEEIDGADEDETYRLLVGTPGSGWAEA